MHNDLSLLLWQFPQSLVLKNIDTYINEVLCGSNSGGEVHGHYIDLDN